MDSSDASTMPTSAPTAAVPRSSIDRSRRGRRQRRPIAPPFAVAIASVLAAAAAHAQVVMAVSPNPGSLPVYVAEAKGYFVDEGVRLNVLKCAIGRLCLRDVIEGRAQLGTVADLPIVLASFAHERFRVLATINTNRNDTKIVTRRDSGIHRAADLVGRKVGTYVGTTAQYALDTVTLFEGADPSRIGLVDLQPGEGRTRLLARDVDAIAVFEPFAYEAAQALGMQGRVIPVERLYTQTWNLVATVARPGIAERDVLGVLRALDKAEGLIRREPAYAKALLRERLGVGAEMIEDSWSALGFELGLTPALLVTLEGQSRWAQGLGTVTGKMPNYLDYVDTTPLFKVKPEAVTIAR